jgi:hypothetical protein
VSDIIEDRGRGFLIEIGEELSRLRADLAQRTAERDEARLEIVDALKEMHTTAGLRRELKRRGWAEWYMEVKR